MALAAAEPAPVPVAAGPAVIAVRELPTEPPPQAGAASADAPAADVDALSQVMRDTERQVSSYCAQLWGGGDVVLPTRKQYVFYAEDWASRGRLDFEGGALLAQALLEPGVEEATVVQSLRTIVAEAVRDRRGDMAAHDLVLRYARQLAAARGLAFRPFKPAPDDEAVMAGVLGPEALAAFSPESLTRTPVVGEDGRTRTMLTYRAPFKPDYRARLAGRYADLVRHEAGRYGLEPSLVFAVIETESAFNPRAMSPAPAYGLMQLVPTSAGREAFQAVFGDRTAPDPEFLYDPEHNVELGAAYLHLLGTRYLDGIVDPDSRRLGAIAAYNTGAGNVARAFVGAPRIRPAVEVINRLTPAAVYRQLQAQLPYEETRRYVVKVAEARERYRSWDQAVVAQAAADPP